MTDQPQEFTRWKIQDLYTIAKSLLASNPDFVVFSYHYDDAKSQSVVEVQVTVKNMMENIGAGIAHDHDLQAGELNHD